VETAEVLRSLGVDHAQGFAIATPEPFEDILSPGTLDRAVGPVLLRAG
jgi:EAL domain-containing protein (putative c-di-GMP-specific phosphodiesterase class I)